MRRVLPGRCDAVVTGVAGTQHLCVVDCEDRHELRICVAVLADIGRRNVSRIFPGCIDTVMAANAIAGDVHMAERRR